MKGIFHYNDGVERKSAQKIKSELSWYISPRTSPPHHSISLRAFSNQMRDQRQDTRHQSYIYSDCVHWRGRHKHALVVWIMLSTPELWQKSNFHLQKKKNKHFPLISQVVKKMAALAREIGREMLPIERNFSPACEITEGEFASVMIYCTLHYNA